MLTELDGLSPRKGVYVVGATNRPDMIDPAMVRPGRLDKLLYIDLPGPLERAEILQALSQKTPLTPEANQKLGEIAARCEGFSGADLHALLREAAVASLREAISHQSESTSVNVSHFQTALQKVTPSISASQRRRYEALKTRLAGIPFGELDVSTI